ncbi:MAG: GNAT family N-acetyltransferase [Candidatus Marinimicrobia bacterium]|nr:GNAT family N-acetyltransferase [Candidatus Neomarinimicrobiota bacterium]
MGSLNDRRMIVIVSPEARGRGYGLQIWHAGLAYLAGRNIGLDGVVDQQDNYKKSGFKLAYRNVRFQGVGGGDCPRGRGIVDLTSIPFSVLEDYDHPFHPDQRSAFLKAWVSQPESQALGIRDSDKLCGYGVIRRCRNGYKVGPLFADTADMAESLFLALKSSIGMGQPVFLDVPEVNDVAVEMAERHGMQAVFETARMYNREIPDMPTRRIFGVTSFEVG